MDNEIIPLWCFCQPDCKEQKSDWMFQEFHHVVRSKDDRPRCIEKAAEGAFSKRFHKVDLRWPWGRSTKKMRLKGGLFVRQTPARSDEGLRGPCNDSDWQGCLRSHGRKSTMETAAPSIFIGVPR